MITQPSSSARHARPSTAGFSLVEVALAVAIASLALITLLGLMPQGLEMSRKTSTLTLNSNILEQIIRDLENTEFALLPTQQTGTASGSANALPEKSRRYFDDQGQQLKQGADNIAYVAEIDFSEPAALPLTEQTQPYLRRVIIRIASSASPEFKFQDSNRLSYSIFSHLLAKSR